MNSIYHAFRESALRYPKNEALVALRTSTEIKMNYADVLQNVDRFAERLMTDGLRAGQSVALMLNNGPEWVIADFAIARCGGIVVPIHTTYTRKYVEYILENADVRYVCVDAGIILTMADVFENATIQKLYVVGSQRVLSSSNTFVLFSDILADTSILKGSLAHTPSENDVHTIVYTSGTLGHPKGVELTHRNILSNVYALVQHIPIDASDRFFSFLPLSHILERTAGYYVPLLHGAAIWYAQSMDTLAEDMVRTQPTVVICVPRIFERVHEKILKKLSANPVVHALFIRSHRAAVRKLQKSLSLSDRVMYYIGERLIFHKVRAVFGGRLRFAVSGGAALPKHIAEFFESLGVLVLEGYGLTETSPVLTANKLEAHRFGTVGLPLPMVTLRIAQNGEILANGDCVMKGYHKAPDLTSEVIDTEGWLHTGDIGFIDAGGFLSIVGRIKEMIVLSTGRNIFPVPIEQALEESPLILQAMVYGDNQRAIAALIVPEFKNLEAWCEQERILYQLPQVLTEEKVMSRYSEELKKMLAHFPHFEQVRNFKLVAEKWTVENDKLTLSQKLKRKKILEENQ